MNSKMRMKIAADALMAISDYCETVDEISDVLREMKYIHEEVCREQECLIGDNNEQTPD